MKNLKGTLSAIKTKVMTNKLAVAAMTSAALVSGTAVASFASEGGGSTPLPTITITQDMLTPLVDGVVSNIGAILPVGLGIFAVFIGIRIIPSVINRFTHA